MEIRSHNRRAWDRQVDEGNRWTVPVTPEAIERARRGELAIVLTPTISVPLEWFPKLKGTKTLCLASGGGQQGPLLAAAGANVTVVDNSPKQLAQDRLVAEREGLSIETVEGDMADLSPFEAASFDLIVHPCSNCFVPEVRPVWRECYRVLRPRGSLLSGFSNPIRYVFDDEAMDRGEFEVRHAIPYSDVLEMNRGRSDSDRTVEVTKHPLEFGHTLDDQIGGQIEAGFVIAGFYEDKFGDDEDDPISDYLSSFIAMRALKLDGEEMTSLVQSSNGETSRTTPPSAE
ncbi:hypothetical protein Pan216_19180 [Planctomycetes bacterium Pan216]|uniref:Methyltransferase type 11 domain-containing protein n=1 Tax=Kolteria novifilia TaxID=2527975 RepID=A0A518B250_9BACT|nr:hypothetical protein Pan216_19180 [Planctomycetes bacterium Pan216]